MEFDLPKDKTSIIKVIGVGGGGGNAVNHMYRQGIEGVSFAVCNTDLQALDLSPVPLKIQLGASLTEGRGAGSKPEVGENAAIENIDEIRRYLENNTKMVFITAGMGGGTGTGAAPVIAKIARELGILTVGIVTVPFHFEGKRRRRLAAEGLEKMRESVDTLIVINNERLREMTGDLPINEAFAKADDVVATAAKGIAEVISIKGVINVDFNDVYTVMKDSGVAIMGRAEAEGENRALKAIQSALESPLLNDNDITGAEYCLLNITYGNHQITMDEITEITDYIEEVSGETAEVIFGHAKDENLSEGKIAVTIIATGFKSQPITGYEKAPQKVVEPLNIDKPREIEKELNSPIDSSVSFSTSEKETKEDNDIEITLKDVQEETKAEEERNLFSGHQPNTSSSQSKEEDLNEVSNNEEKEIIKLKLTEDDVNDIENQKKETPKKEDFKRVRESNLSRLKDLSQIIKKAGKVSELEKEPAFKRRGIEPDFSSPSEDSGFTRLSINNDKNGPTLNNNNSFLHDNVD